jgi:hypothetical protein
MPTDGSLQRIARWALENSQRSASIMNLLKRWPALVDLMVEWVQTPT